MLPEVQIYADAVDAAEETLEAAFSDSERLYNKAIEGADRPTRDKAYREHQARCHAYQEIRDATVKLAWGRLGLSEDPLIQWMATQIHTSYRSEHADKILRILPATLEQMKQVARDNDWCGEFTNLMNQAIQAGVISDGRTPERRQLDYWITSNWGHRYVSPIMDMVNAILRAEAQGVVDAANAQAQEVQQEAKAALKPSEDDDPEEDDDEYEDYEDDDYEDDDE